MAYMHDFKSYCNDADQQYTLREKYFLPTEQGFVENVTKFHDHCQVLDLSTQCSALMVGNSYILSSIAQLPDNISTVYLCDIDPVILNYASETILCACSSKSHAEFILKLRLIQAKYCLLSVVKKHENDQHWMSEQFLDETSFASFKAKIQKISVHFRAVNLFDAPQVEQIVSEVAESKQEIGLFSFSNIHQFDTQNKLQDSLIAGLSKVTVSSPFILYSNYYADDVRTLKPRRPVSLVSTAPICDHFPRIKKIKDILPLLLNEDIDDEIVAACPLIPSECRTREGLLDTLRYDQNIISENALDWFLNGNIALLDALREQLDRRDLKDPVRMAGEKVQQEAANTVGQLSLEEEKLLAKGLALTIMVVKESAAHNGPAAQKLNTFAATHLEGRSLAWKKVAASLAFLAGIAMLGLAVAGVPFSAGASLVGMYIGGSLLAVGGAAFFHHGKQKRLSLIATQLANTAQSVNEPFQRP